MTMTDLDAVFVPVAHHVAAASALAMVLIVVAWAIRAGMGHRLSPAWRTALWLVVGFRLILPIGIESPWSVEAAFRRAASPFRSAVPTDAQPVAPVDSMRIEVRYESPFGLTTPAAMDRTSDARSQLSTLPRWLAVIWLTGVILLLARQIVMAARLRRRAAAMPAIDDARILALAADAAKAIRVDLPFRIVRSETLRSPALCGIRQPTLFLPDDPMMLASDVDLRLVLLHEFAHLRRRDPLVAMLAGFVCAVHWFNPLVWLAAGWMRDDRELACDAAVLRAAGEDMGNAYGLCLLRVAERVSHLAPHPAAVGVLSSFRHLKRRIMMISQFDIRHSWSNRLCGMMSIFLLGTAAITCAPADRPTAVATTREATLPTDDAGSSPGAVGSVTRTYDIRDLLINYSDLFDIRPSGSSDNPQHDREPESREQMVERLISVVCSTVDPDSWRQHGGTIGVIEELRGQLIVTQTLAAQAQIVELFDRMREHRSLQVNVTARFVSIDADKVPAEFAALLSDKTPETSANPSSAFFVPADKIATLVRALHEDAGATTLTAPKVTLFNGQRAYVTVSTEQAYVSTFHLTQSAPGERKFEPMVDVANSGVTFDVQATASVDRKHVALTLKPKVTKLVRMETMPFAGVPGEMGLVVQKPIIETQEMNITLSVPDGETCVIRSGPDGTDRKQVLLLLVTPEVIDHKALKRVES